jgi:3-methyladenine DNA glycosylase AlkD
MEINSILLNAEPQSRGELAQISMTKREVLSILKKNGSDAVIEQMKYFGNKSQKAFGNKAPFLRKLQKQIGTDHALALSLWNTGFHEARIIAALIADPNLVTKDLMELWVNEFDTWGICDACCGELFCYTPYAISKSYEWSTRKKEYVKRAGFVLMTELALHNKNLDDKIFIDFFPVIIRESTDERNFVRKGVNWALRQIGKRNIRLHTKALAVAKTLSTQNDATARWIGNDAIRDLNSDSMQRRILRWSKKL